jgi:hypothetical protein
MEQNRIKLYFDIDGVLLKRDSTLADNAEPFLEWCISNFDCFWSTTRDRVGLDGIIAAFKGQLPEPLIQKIKPTQWLTLKTEAIDLKSNYYLIDDGLLATEREVVGDRWISVNVNRDPDGIKKVWDHLKHKISRNS